jgi:hypothetical protein
MDARRVIAVLSLAALLAACDSPRKPLEADDLKIAAQQLESIAGEADWLAKQLRDGDVTQNMAWVHQHALGEDAVKATSKLAKPVPPPLREAHAQVVESAGRLQMQLGRIAGAAGQAEELDALRRDIQAVGHAVAPVARPA